MSDPVNPPTFVATSPLTARAFALARERHEGQRRKADGADFLLHPLEVAAILAAVPASKWLQIGLKSFWSLPPVMLCVAVHKRKIASLIMPVGR